METAYKKKMEGVKYCMKQLVVGVFYLWIWEQKGHRHQGPLAGDRLLAVRPCHPLHELQQRPSLYLPVSEIVVKKDGRESKLRYTANITHVDIYSQHKLADNSKEDDEIDWLAIAYRAKIGLIVSGIFFIIKFWLVRSNAIDIIPFVFVLYWAASDATMMWLFIIFSVK